MFSYSNELGHVLKKISDVGFGVYINLVKHDNTQSIHSEMSVLNFAVIEQYLGHVNCGGDSSSSDVELWYWDGEPEAFRETRSPVVQIILLTRLDLT